MASTAHAGTLTYYFHTDCGNGFTDADVIVSVYDKGGCVGQVVGVDCNGHAFSFAGPRQPRDYDLGFPYEMPLSGRVPNLGPWYAKIQMNAGNVTRVWGQQANGNYYEIEPSN